MPRRPSARSDTHGLRRKESMLTESISIIRKSGIVKL